MEPHSFSDVAQILRYDEETGKLFWRIKRSNNVLAGQEAGTLGRTGYIVIGIDRKYYKAHRLAILLTSGAWPAGVVDHVNGIKIDNRLIDLRVASHAENCRNQGISRNNACGVKGVHWHIRRRKWAASIRLNWKLHHLGYFDTIEAAAAAYNEASLRLHGEFGRLTEAKKAAGRIPVDA